MSAIHLPQTPYNVQYGANKVKTNHGATQWQGPDRCHQPM